ncbi:MAG: STAS domain-containing protein [Sulfitobacter sp.]|nr:STAS domain-containing protein [Sulfitobacter sp.]
MTDPVMPEGKLDLTAASALHDQLQSVADHDVIVNFEKVTMIGALCLQVFIAAARGAKAANRSFQIINAPDAVLAQLKSMGFTPESLAEGSV